MDSGRRDDYRPGTDRRSGERREKSRPEQANRRSRDRRSPGRLHRDLFYSRLDEMRGRGEEGLEGGRLLAAITCVGGPERLYKAMQIRTSASGLELSWAAVCCEQAFGLKSGDPQFAAWLRLALTPVRHIKEASRPEEDQPETPSPRRRSTRKWYGSDHNDGELKHGITFSEEALKRLFDSDNQDDDSSEPSAKA